MPTNIEGVDSPFGSDGRLLLLPRRQPQLVQLHQSENHHHYYKSDYYHYYYKSDYYHYYYKSDYYHYYQVV